MKRKFGKTIAMLAVVTLMACMLAVTAFAADPPSAAVTSEMLAPLLDGILANIAVIIPIGIGIFAIMIGIRFVPKILGMFTKK